MRAASSVGIVVHGASVPRHRRPTRELARIWRTEGAAEPAVAEKSVVALDEDVVTMAIEAGRTAVARGLDAGLTPEAIGVVWVGTESKAYAVKPRATIAADALGITPRTAAADLEFACKAGSEVLQAATAFVGSGIADAGYERADGLFVGNLLGSSLNRQENVATLIADAAGLRGIEALRLEAACASGAAAVRAAPRVLGFAPSRRSGVECGGSL
jgi:3-hydroxy-3-methylglutaryl CoA synthase